MSSANEVKYRPNITESSFGLIQQLNISAAASVDRRVVASTGAEENKSFSKPVFAEKESSADVSYHWMIATNTEFVGHWGYFLRYRSVLSRAVPKCNFQDDCKVPDLWSRSVCPPAE